ncbi:MAG TPA: RAMP superfamily CRISPR-associated protein [Alphaproteobacteria bacterium]|nr:RAMP superfamily CRISPR-associated protein [Alphaproteobacteria bacterium]
MKLEIDLAVVSALCVGSTADAQGIGVDKVTARDADGKLIIPGSTLKGRLRWECERVARALGWAVCHAPRPDTMCPYDLPLQDGRPSFCIVCEIFGASGQRSPLWFNDAALQLHEELQSTPLGKSQLASHERRAFDAQIRPGVSISRRRRAAFSQRLFFTETSAPNARFLFRACIEGELPSDQHRALLLAGVRMLSFVGGGRSRGLGWVRVATCRIDGHEVAADHWPTLLQPLQEVGK